MAEQAPNPEQLVQIDYRPPRTGWMNPAVEFRKGTFCYSAAAKNVRYLDMPNPRDWQPFEQDWKLPPDWKEIIVDGIRERLEKYRSFRLFMDICVRCGACADKCHFYVGSGDPKNMPVLRAELLRSVYRRYFTVSGRLFGNLAGARDLDEETRNRVLEWMAVNELTEDLKRRVMDITPPARNDQMAMFGESLPLGIVLRA